MSGDSDPNRLYSYRYVTLPEALYRNLMSNRAVDLAQRWNWTYHVVCLGQSPVKGRTWRCRAERWWPVWPRWWFHGTCSEGPVTRRPATRSPSPPWALAAWAAITWKGASKRESSPCVTWIMISPPRFSKLTQPPAATTTTDRKSTRLNSSHLGISY